MNRWSLLKTLWVQSGCNLRIQQRKSGRIQHAGTSLLQESLDSLEVMLSAFSVQSTFRKLIAHLKFNIASQMHS